MKEHVFKLPDLGEGLESGEISRWLVAEGDEVAQNQPLVEVNTEKALVEIPSPVAGRVGTLHAGEGDEVAVGAPLVTFLVADDADVRELGPDAEPAVEEGGKRRAVLVGYGVDADEETKEKPRRGLRLPKRPREGKPLASPAVRKHAQDLGVDLASLVGTGPDGHITHEDVERAGRAEAPAAPRPAAAPEAKPLPEEPGDERQPLQGTRRIVARRMAEAWARVPHVTTYLTVDAGELEEYRDELSVQLDRRITALPIVVRVFADVLGGHPRLNAWFDDAADELVCKPSVHAGIATDTEHGLLVPVVRDVAEKGIDALTWEIAELTEGARAQSLRPEQLKGSTITVSNVGAFRAEYGTPIVNLPEVAILAVGVIEERALAVRGHIEVRPAATLSLSFDHRVVDGAEAGRALADLRDRLVDPDALRALPV